MPARHHRGRRARPGPTVPQAAVVRWTRDALEVLDSGARVVSRSGWTFDQLRSRPCPVPRPDPGDTVCRDPGGPWISASIKASAKWRADRDTVLRSLGCDVCDSGRPAGPGGKPILLWPRTVPNRYGGPAYLDQERNR